MSSDDILLGLALVLVLAVGSQLLAVPLRVPALVLLLPAGFVAGILTEDVHPDALLGALYQPFVTVAVGVILFEAGLRLSVDEVNPAVRGVVVRLVLGGALVTWLTTSVAVTLLFDDVDRGVAFVIGAILIVSGPTVVLPLLAFIRPTRDVRSLLKWEGTLIDPIGALLGVLVFGSVSSASGWQPGSMLFDLAVGGAVAAVAAPLLVFGLGVVHRSAPRMIVPSTLMVVVAAVVAADLIRDDTGLAAAVLLGIAVSHQHVVDVSHSLFEFEETLVTLLIGVLFVLVAASVSPDDVRSVLPEALGLVAIMILLVRPAAVALSTVGSRFTWHERAFVAWMAPRGIVAGATASAFGPQLAEAGVAGADTVLPTVFVAIFGTVVVYGLTAGPVARLLGVAEEGRRLVLLVGGHAWAVELGAALQRAGVAVRLWAGPAAHQEAAREAGLVVDHGRIMLDAMSREEDLEEVTDALLLTRSDDFNTVAAAELRTTLGHGHVFRLAPHPDEPNLLPPLRETGILGDRALSFGDLEERFAAGARVVLRRGDEPAAAGDLRVEMPLFAVTPRGGLRIAADGRPLEARAGDTVVSLAVPRTIPV